MGDGESSASGAEVARRRDLFWMFGVTEPRRFLDMLRKQNAVVTGTALLGAVGMSWKTKWQLATGAFSLDVLCPPGAAQSEVMQYLLRCGYAVSGGSCRHTLGEWTGLPEGSVACLTRGEHGLLSVVHVVRLKMRVQEVITSRVYGTMVGTYLTGRGVVFSLFPHITFAQRGYWVADDMRPDSKQSMRVKYSGWSEIDEGGPEVCSVRHPGDRQSLLLHLGEKGLSVRQEPQEYRCPLGKEVPVGFSRSALDYGKTFLQYDSSTWAEENRTRIRVPKRGKGKKAMSRQSEL
ncbi:uncharacterized protein B0I36DRAFT_316200 [Microdochium trichocladiopsis]|uniref:Uncharacterized protein n=1 Tax=Microdochium trichocladiopsis TaxID=1682393 RepID=A0A9P8YFD1_9PEZI|nr:uncharacterized protein B0I36DRAFT_316200 [Microdochium trichocladiopsis]KAH7038420.1 hypothetical protein B0I36DRAFT_316200 [Microdochium trichocladiopsis]